MQSRKYRLRSRTGSRGIHQAVNHFCEPLEMRVLLSTINWSNKGTAISDTDNFNASFGGNSTVARTIVQRAIDDWERVIVDFNYLGGGNTYNVSVSAGNLGAGVRGGTGSITTLVGKPTSAAITLDDDGGGSGWYFDPVVGTSFVPDDGEFVNLSSPFEATFTGAGAAADDNDLYRTIVHELGHAMGIAIGGSLLINTFLTDTGIDDPFDSASATLQNFNPGGGVIATLTENGGGHLFEGPGQGGGTLGHPNDLMNAGRTVNPPPTTRQLITDLDATILADAYAYTIALPSTINTFYANLNTTTNVVTVTGDANPSGSVNDTIGVNVSGASQVFSVNGTTETIAGGEISTITVNALSGADAINMDALLSGKTVTVNAGEGGDSVRVAFPQGDLDTALDSNFTLNGGNGTDSVVFWDDLDGGGGDDYTITSTQLIKNASVIDRIISYATMESMTIVGSGQPSTYDINSLSSALTGGLSILAGAADDTITVGGTSGDIDSLIFADVSVSGGSGTDALIYNDSADDPSVDDSYMLTSGSFGKSSSSRSFTYSAVENITLEAGLADNPITIASVASGTSVTVNGNAGTDAFYLGDAVGSVGAGSDDIRGPVSLNGGAGDDFFYIGNGDLDETSAAIVVNGGGPTGGTNTLVVNDVSDTGGDTYTLVDGLLTKPGAGSFVSLDYSYISVTTINANQSDNVINLTDPFGFPTVQGNGGTDTFNVISSIAGAQTPTIRGGAGLDFVNVNQDATGTATAVFDQSEDLATLQMFEGSTVDVKVVAGDLAIVTDSMGFVRGRLNLNDNYLVLHNAAPVSFFVDKLARGYNAGGWNGVPAGGAAGVILSGIAASSPLGDGLGYAQVGVGAGLLNIANYRGTPVAAGNLIISYTLYGDANLDRTVDITDLASLATNWQLAGRNWVQGNFNYDNLVDITDLAQLATNWQLAAPGPSFDQALSQVFSAQQKRLIVRQLGLSAPTVDLTTASPVEQVGLTG